MYSPSKEAMRNFQVKPMMTLSAINNDANKHEKEQISRTVQEKFEETDMWLVQD